MQINSQESINWFDKVKQNLNFKACVEKLGLQTCKIIEILCFFGGAFLIGILLKKYFRVIFLSIIFLIIALFILNNFKLITIDWIKIKAFTGINPAQSVSSITKSYMEWFKKHLILIISAFIGFLIGYKIG